jgi:hypothetical protein
MTTRFVGWHRRGPERPWREMCAADTEDACWQILLRSGPAGGDRCTLPAGRTPFRPAAGDTFARHRRG